MNDWKLRLRQAREAKELNKTEFARLVGVSNATVTDWEKSSDDGGIKELSGPKLAKISEILEVDPHWIMSGKLPQEARVTDTSSGQPPARAAPVRKVEAEAAKGLQWVTAREADLLSTFRALKAPDQETVVEMAKSFTPVLVSRSGTHKT